MESQLPNSILFVCTGNTCRSPMAAAIFNWLLERNYPQHRGKIRVGSAGLCAPQDCPATTEAVTVAAGKGIDLKGHRTCQVNEDLLGEYELIITMTRDHREAICQRYPALAERTFTLREMAGEPPGDVTDPIGGDVGVYQETFDQMERLIKIMQNRMLGQ